MLTGVEEPGKTDDVFQLLPNPAGSSISISIDESLINSSVAITDLTGRRVTETQLTTTNIQLSTETLSNGVYFVIIGGTNGQFTHKLVIQK